MNAHDQQFLNDVEEGTDAFDRRLSLLARNLVAAAKRQQLRHELPAFYETDGEGDKAVATMKFFTPWTSWTWYATEFDGDDQCFGLIQGLEEELGYFSLRELESLRGPFGLRIERDLHFTPKPLGELRKAVWGKAQL